MRTTLTLDDDVAAMLRRAMKESGRTLKEQVNEALRAGLSSRQPRRVRRRVTRSFDGGRALISLESTSEALAIAEGEHFR